MRVRLTVSPDAIIDVGKDGDGNVLWVEFSPLFPHDNATAIIAYGQSETEKKDRVLDRFTLVVSGATGKITKRGRPVSSVAGVDKVGPIEAPDEAADEAPDEEDAEDINPPDEQA